jgi:hypothetical protein
MQNPFQAAAGNNMNDPLAFVKKLWGDMQLPGMVTPTLSVDELDKQIKDLKTVESWLNVNMNMLKGTIQALEVQRATISALKTMGESFAQATATTTPASTTANHDTAASWPMHAANKAASKAENKAAAPVPKEPTVEENEDEEYEEEEIDDMPPEDQSVKTSTVPESEIKSVKSDNPPMHNPAAWWTVLQDQFKQALSHAMKDETPEKTATSSPAAPKKTTKTSNKAVAKVTLSGRSSVKKATPAKTSKATTSAVKPKAASKPVQKSATKLAAKAPSKPRARSQ